jgi:competence protein ComEC
MRVICMLLLLGFAHVAVGATAPNLDIYFIDVDHGDAILVDCGSWEALIDVGPNEIVPREHLACMLGDLVTDGTIELLILTHPHADHCGGYCDVLCRYEVSEFWQAANGGRGDQCDAYSELLAARRDERPSSPPRGLEVGDRVTTGCLEWTVLGPTSPNPGASTDSAIDDNSLVLLLQYGSVSFLFPGDLQTSSEDDLLQVDLPETALVLKVPHHGLDTATSRDQIGRAHV